MTRPPQSPPRLPGLTFLELLGSGGFSDVFAYRQEGLDREVAVKVMLSNLGPDLAAQFEVEARTMAKLSLHASVVPVYAAGVAPDGRSYLVLQLCDRRSLAARIRRPLQVGRTLDIAIQIAGALETAHRLGIIHRDIKPANILFITPQRPALTDFGIAAHMSAAGGVNAFSVPWAAPEQLAGRPAGPGVDIYGLAATTFAMLTGHSPFEVQGGPNDPFAVTQRVQRDPAPLTGRPDVPESLERLLAITLSKDPSRRYASALEFAHALQAIQTELGIPPTRIDVLTDADDDWDDGATDSGTRLTSFAVLDPDAGGTTTADALTWAEDAAPSAGWLQQRPAPEPVPVQQHGAGRAQPREIRFTGAEVPEAPPLQPEEPQPRERPHRARMVTLVVGVVLLIAAAIGGGTVLASSGPRATTDDQQPQATVVPADPIGQVVPSPTDARAVPEGEVVEVTWTNPDPADGDRYLYRVLVPGQERPYERTDQTSVLVVPQPGRTCVEIRIIRATGRDSDPAVACTEA